MSTKEFAQRIYLARLTGSHNDSGFVAKEPSMFDAIRDAKNFDRIWDSEHPNYPGSSVDEL